MAGEMISIVQIVTVVVFLAALIGALVLVRRHGAAISGHLNMRKRTQIVSDMALSNSERLRIVDIDGTEYVVVSGRSGTPAFYRLPTAKAPQQEGRPVRTPGSIATVAMSPTHSNGGRL
ncbi:MAG: hypothetical protein EBT71_08275 [Alphaproteobacteria bacterium]|jgi:hypothetical protein|nr:hypothetical protein [Alphaproteobacteria bacterium]